MDAVLTGDNGEAARRNANAVLPRKAVAGCCDLVRSAGKHEVVLGDNAVAGRRLNGHSSVAVERQILLGEDHSIDIVFIDGGKRPAVGEGIDRARSHREKDLVSLPDVDRGGGFGMNIRAVQHEVQESRYRRKRLMNPDTFPFCWTPPAMSSRRIPERSPLWIRQPRSNMPKAF